MEQFPNNIEKLLLDNYDCITSGSGIECMKFVLDFITNNESVSDLNPISTKCLTKVASHIINSDCYIKLFGLNSSEKLIPLLEKVYWFNIDGASNIEFSDIKQDSSLKEKTKSHFLSHAAKAADKLFVQTNESKWAINYYNTAISSAKISENLDRFHSFHMYGFASKIAKELYSLTKDINWVLKSYNAQMSSSEISESLDTRHCGFSLGITAELAQILFESTKELDWAKKAYDCYVSAARLLTSFKPTSCAYFYHHAGKVAQNIYNLSKEPAWKENSINNYNLCISKIQESKLDDISHLIHTSQKKIDELNPPSNEISPFQTTFSLKNVFNKVIN